MKEALKLALKALEHINDRFDLESVAQDATTAITAIKEALAQPEQEPVKWAMPQGWWIVESTPDELNMWPTREDIPLYAEPWHRASSSSQEPVACDCRLQADECNGDTATFHPFQVGASCSTRLCERVYTTPPKRPWVGLTDERMWELWNSQGDDAMEQQAAIAFARAIEAASKEKNT